MSSFFKKHKKAVLISTVVLVLLGCIVLTSGGGKLSVGENFFGTVTKPFTSVFNGVMNFFGGSVSGKKNEIQLLREENQQLKQDVSALEDLTAENNRLKGLLNYQESNPDYEYVTVGVTARSGNYWFNTFTIGQGKSSGISVNMPVVGQNGLVGKVTEVGATFAKVTSLIDTSSSVSAMVERTRDNGTVKGEMETASSSFVLTLQHLPVDSSVQPGDRIITSGLGGVYPKGILIGTVSEVQNQPDGGKLVRIEPATDFLHLEEVMVMKSRTGENLLG